MSGFDPERYLRSLGERALAGGGDLQHAWLNGRVALPQAAAALAAVGRIDADRAATIVGDYAALGADPNSRGHLMGAAAPAPAVPLSPRRAWPLALEVPTGFGMVVPSALITGGDLVEVIATVEERPGRPFGRPGTLLLVTPGGVQVPLSFSGDRHADGSFRGRATLEDPLPRIELGGVTVELAPLGAPRVIATAPRTPVRPALDHLWNGLAALRGPRHQLGPWLEGSAAALIAASELAPDDPELAALRWVAEHHLSHRNRWGPPRPRTGTRPAEVPDRWLSELAGPSGPGRHAVVTLGAVAPVTDGVAVGVDLLASTEDVVTLHAVLSGALPGHLAGDSIRDTPLSCWIATDRGEHRVGAVIAAQSDDTMMTAQLSFAPIHRDSSRVTVSFEIPTTTFTHDVDLDEAPAR